MAGPSYTQYCFLDFSLPHTPYQMQWPSLLAATEAVVPVEVSVALEPTTLFDWQRERDGEKETIC